MTARRTLPRLLFAAAGALASLFCVEGAVRLYSAVANPKMMALDPVLGWKHLASRAKAFTNEIGEHAVMVLNAQGMRGPSRSSSKPPGVFRILVLGDSFAEGAQVGEADLFSARLEDSRPGLEVLNAGVGAYGTVQEYLYLLHDGLHYRPDLVLLMFYENDLADNCMSYEPGFGPRPYAVWSGGEVHIVAELESRDYLKFTLPVPFRMTLNERSYLYYFLNRNVYQRLRKQEMNRRERADAEKVPLATKLSVFYGLVGKTKDLLDGRGIDFRLIVIPTKTEIATGRSDLNDPIRRFCDERGLPCLFLFDRFRQQAAKGEQLYFTTDIHWTRAAHRVAAEEIGRTLFAGSGRPQG